MGRKFALLIGIDDYLDGPRTNTQGTPVRLNNLEGCANDVAIVAELLQRFGFQDSIRLISPTSLSSTAAPPTLHQEDNLPTSGNIRAEFDRLLEGARDGDLFFFHYSGHGALLNPINQSPADGRRKDPSLLPMDYCCNEPAIRGWQLNNLLRRFHEKGIHVVVSLDSCFSGGAWRDDGTPRSPADWIPPPNLPSDEAVDDFLTALPDGRHGTLEKSWDINPEGFVLMAACLKDQVALEMSRDAKKHGVFTHTMCQYLTSRDMDGQPTYRSICDCIRNSIPPSQTPQAFGRDRLAFLETRETFMAASVQVRVDRMKAVLPIGKVHGVTKGMVLVSRWTTSDVLLTIENVDEFESKGSLSEAFDSAMAEFVPWKWYSEKTFEVLVDTTLGGEFPAILQDSLQNRIASRVSVIEDVKVARDGHSGAIRFQLRKGADDRIDILAPTLTGYQEPAHCVQSQDSDQVANKAADALAHLFRFAQVHSLRDEITEDTPMFRATLDSTSSPEAPFADGHSVRYTFKNDGDCDLYFTVLDLGPGFHIQQMFPARDAPQKMPPGATRSFRFKLTVPRELREGHVRQEGPHRDILRTVVTRGEPLSLKSMELPDIWDADQMNHGKRRSTGRDMIINSESDYDFAWWIKDIEVYTWCDKQASGETALVE